MNFTMKKKKQFSQWLRFFRFLSEIYHSNIFGKHQKLCVFFDEIYFFLKKFGETKKKAKKKLENLVFSL